MTDTSASLSKRRQLLAASALVPIVGALSRPISLQALIYTFFVCVYLAPFVIQATKKKNANLEAPLEGPAPDGSSLADGAAAQIKQLKKSRRLLTVNFVLATVGAGLGSQCLAWLSQFLLIAGNNDPVPYQAGLLETLLFGLFFYVGLAIIWLGLMQRWQFELKEVFFVCFLGSLIEHGRAGTLAAICEKLVSDPVAALLTLSSMLVVGGSISALGFLAGERVGPHVKRQPMLNLLTKYAVSIILIGLLLDLTCNVGLLFQKDWGPDGQQPIKVLHLL